MIISKTGTVIFLFFLSEIWLSEFFFPLLTRLFSLRPRIRSNAENFSFSRLKKKKIKKIKKSERKRGKETPKPGVRKYIRYLSFLEEAESWRAENSLSYCFECILNYFSGGIKVSRRETFGVWGVGERLRSNISKFFQYAHFSFLFCFFSFFLSSPNGKMCKRVKVRGTPARDKLFSVS